MRKYLALKEAHRKRFESFEMFFAFNKQQFAEGLAKLNATQEQIIGTGAGGFMRKVDLAKFTAMMDEIQAENDHAMTDNEYLYEAFCYELANHEYNYTHDDTDTLRSLGLTAETLTDNQREILAKAKCYANV